MKNFESGSGLYTHEAKCGHDFLLQELPSTKAKCTQLRFCYLIVFLEIFFFILTLDWYGLPFCLCQKTWATHLIPALRLLCCVLLCMESSAPDASRKIESILFLQYLKAQNIFDQMALETLAKA